MAPFTAQCGACGKKYKIGNSDSIGKKTKCKACGELMLLEPVGSSSKKQEVGGLQSVAMAGRSSTRKKKSSSLISEEEREALMRGDRPERLGTPGSDRLKMLIALGATVGQFALGVIFFLICFAIITAMAVSEKAELPSELTVLDVSHFPYRVKQPVGWETMYTGGRNGAASYLKYSSGPAMIEVDEENPALRAEPQPVKMDRPDLDTVAKVHQKRLALVQKKYKKYSESKDERYKGSTSRRISTFTCQPLFSAPMKGVRITILNSQYQLYVICMCPEEDFDDFSPYFYEIVDSIR